MDITNPVPIWKTSSSEELSPSGYRVNLCVKQLYFKYAVIGVNPNLYEIATSPVKPYAALRS